MKKVERWVFPHVWLHPPCHLSQICPLAFQVYMHLIKLHLSPPNFTDYDIHLPDGSEPKASVKDAFKVLIAHHDDIDIRKVWCKGLHI